MVEMPSETDKPRIYVDGRLVRTTGPRMTGAQILAAAGLEPDEYGLRAVGHDAVRVPDEQPVEVHDGARFETYHRSDLV